MAIATWQDLCIDANDADRLGHFWASALGLTFKGHDDGDAQLDGPTPEHRVWINTVPNRSPSSSACTSTSTSAPSTRSSRWARHPRTSTASAGRSCATPRAASCARSSATRSRRYKLYEIAVDAADPQAIARWWADVLGATYGEDDEHGWTWVENIPGAPFECLTFSAVPEPKTVKNRIHWDVKTDEVALLVDAGATVLQTQPRWTIMADPEGNEFCAFLREEH